MFLPPSNVYPDDTRLSITLLLSSSDASIVIKEQVLEGAV